MSNFLLEAGRQTLMLELQEASRLPERLGDDFIRAAETIIHCEGKLIVSGIGKSGHIGKKLAATFASTGTPAFFVHPAEALHGDLGMLDSRDVMLFISYSGSAKELDLIVPRLEEKGIPLLAMTGKSTSPLALAAKAVLDIAVEREACPMHLQPYELNELARRGEWDEFEKRNGCDCMECGSCNYICPAKRHLTQAMKLGRKMALANRKMRAQEGNKK